MNEIVKRSFKATPLIVRVAYKIFCIVYRPNKNLKKNGCRGIRSWNNILSSAEQIAIF